MRDVIQVAKAQGRFAPDVVFAYAALLLTDDDGLPITPQPHHKLWMKLACDDRIERLLMIGPPESAKTTWMVSAYLGCRIGFYPEQSVIIGSVSDDTAEKRSLSLRTMVENETWQSVFPNVLKDKFLKWEQKEWSIADAGESKAGRIHPTVRAYGTGSSITGSRADLLLGDDLLDFDNSRTKHGRDLVDEWFHNSFLSRKKAGVGRVIIIGTSWNADDTYARIRKNPIGWTICHVPLMAIDEDGFYARVTRGDN
jgi:hypothetical protein